MLSPDLDQAIAQDHRATAALITGNPEPKKAIYSHHPDATLANPLGPPVRGWADIAAELERVAAQMRDGEQESVERVCDHATADLAYIVEIERSRMKVAGSQTMSPVELRVTTIYCREGDAWSVIHRHADPITSARSITTTVSTSSSVDR